MTKPTECPAWKDLQHLSAEFKHEHFKLTKLFEKSNRFSDFSISHDNLLFDYSKNYVTTESLTALIQLATEMQLPEAIDAMFSGKEINNTEECSAWHTALRIPETENSHNEVVNCLQKMDSFVTSLYSGSWLGFSGEKIKDVVNIGIGGSDLGPSFAYDALSDYSTGKLKLHLVSNLDPTDLDSVTEKLNPATTLFIITSKSFSTPETIQNAETAKSWLLTWAKSSAAVKSHFVGVTANSIAARKFGLAEGNLFPMWDWIGGRYSLWSAAGLPIALSIGMDNFRKLLSGAHSMDEHFKNSDLINNIPVIMGLLSVFYSNFLEAHSHAVIPYSQKLQKLPAYLQQLCMESLGKCVTKNGEPVTTKTGNVLWGAAGTNAQHSFFQLLHQGTEFIPVDLIAFIKSTSKGEKAELRHIKLLANCLGQSLSLMKGSNFSSNPHKTVSGNKPSNTLLIRELNPYNLGSLVALYEHKTYVQSVIWNINAFDQWGVELGKSHAEQLVGVLKTNSVNLELDDSTKGLLNRIQEAIPGRTKH